MPYHTYTHTTDKGDRMKYAQNFLVSFHPANIVQYLNEKKVHFTQKKTHRNNFEEGKKSIGVFII